MKRAFMDTTSLLGAKPLKASIGLVVVFIGAVVLSVVFGQDAWDKVAWSVLSLVVAIAIFLACWFVFLLRTPWRFEDEAAIERAAEHKGMLAKMDELKVAIEERQAQHREDKARLESEVEKLREEHATKEKTWQAEREELQTFDVDRNLKRHKIRTYIDDFRKFLERVTGRETRAVSQLYKFEADVNRRLREDFEYDDFRRNNLLPLARQTSLSEMQRRAQAGEPAREIRYSDEDYNRAAECCNDRIAHLETLLALIG